MFVCAHTFVRSEDNNEYLLQWLSILVLGTLSNSLTVWPAWPRLAETEGGLPFIMRALGLAFIMRALGRLSPYAKFSPPTH